MISKDFIMGAAINVFSSKLYVGIAHRFITAFSTLPSTEAWLYSAVLLLLLAVISLPIGFQLGFLRLEVLDAPWITTAGIVVNCFFRPAIAEELFFRILLLPHPSENPSTAAQWFWGCISLVIFIAYHPLNGMSFYPAGLKTFLNPVFLLLAALLGIVCSISYLHGSIWPPVVIHWLVVVVWLLWLGGYRPLQRFATR